MFEVADFIISFGSVSWSTDGTRDVTTLDGTRGVKDAAEVGIYEVVEVIIDGADEGMDGIDGSADE